MESLVEMFPVQLATSVLPVARQGPWLVKKALARPAVSPLAAPAHVRRSEQTS